MTDFRRIYGVHTAHCWAAGRCDHLGYRSSNVGGCDAKCINSGIGTGDDGTGINAGHGCEYALGSINLRNPFCCSAFQRGRVISAHLLRSPASSDCAFIPVGCSVSSRYTFPHGGLGSALSVETTAYHKLWRIARVVFIFLQRRPGQRVNRAGSWCRKEVRGLPEKEIIFKGLVLWTGTAESPISDRQYEIKTETLHLGGGPGQRVNRAEAEERRWRNAPVTENRCAASRGAV